MQVNLNVPETLMTIVNEITAAGGSVFCVGGIVREVVMEHEWGIHFDHKDIDFEVFGIESDTLVNILREHGETNVVGVSFGVIKFTNKDGEFDFSLPRTENKNGVGHKGFIVEFDKNITPKEAAARRDFTMNAMSVDPLTGELFDWFGGVNDIRNRILRPTSDKFGEDALRVLRGFQFAGRFNMTLDPAAKKVCSDLAVEFGNLAQDRVREEWMKWATKSVKPSAGLRFLKDAGWLHLFPEINAMVGVPQDSVWHPEGDVFEHTCHVCDAMAFICDRAGITGMDRAIRMFSALAHDFAKPETTVLGNGKFGVSWMGQPRFLQSAMKWVATWSWRFDIRFRSPGHAEKGVDPAMKFMNGLFKVHGQNGDAPLAEKVALLTKMHMRHIGFNGSKSQVRRMAASGVNMGELRDLVDADSNGRPFDASAFVHNLSMTQMFEVAEGLDVASGKPEPILMGRHLIGLGLKPGKMFGKILDAAFEAQINGEFVNLTEALAWLTFFNAEN